MMDDNVEIIRSNKGGMKLIHRGYMYTVHKKRQSGGIRWRCTQRSLHCKGSISTGNGPPKVNMPHNHIPDPHSVALARCRQFEEFADLTPLVETECDELEETRVAPSLPKLEVINMSKSVKSDSVKNLKFKVQAYNTRYTGEFKKKVIMFAERHCNSAAERVFGVPESNIRRWKKAHLLSKTFEGRTKRIVKRVDQANRDFVYESASLDPLKKIKIDSSLLSRITENNGAKSQGAPKNTSQSTSSPKLKVIIKQPTLLVPKMPAPSEADMEEVCLRWNSHHNNMKSCFPSLLQREQYVDVTLASEGKTLKCHRLILSSCSTYFDEILSGISPFQHPVIFINGVEFWILRLLIDFMYAGEVHIEQNKLPQLLKVAQMLQIKGLTGKSMSGVESNSNKDTVQQPTQTNNVNVEDEPKKEPTPQNLPAKQPTKTLKLIPASMITSIDPLALLKPTFIEESPESSKMKEQPKKTIAKKMRKRKSSEHEVSPPPILFRKGTKSRPNIKVPRYYHNDYEDVKVPKQEDESTTDDAYDLNKVKCEPLDIEDTDVGFTRQGEGEQSNKNEGTEATGESAKGIAAVTDCKNAEGDDPVKEDDEASNNNSAK